MTSETKKTAIDLRPLVVSGTDVVLNSEGRLVALCMRGINEDPEIAAFIVKAVNNHDALVAMVEELKMLVRVTGPLTTARERADKLLNSLK